MEECGGLTGGRRKASLIHPEKAIYVRITLPEQARQEHCCTSNYLIREAVTLRGGSGQRGGKGGDGGKQDTDWVTPEDLLSRPHTLITAAISTSIGL